MAVWFIIILLTFQVITILFICFVLFNSSIKDVKQRSKTLNKDVNQDGVKLKQRRFFNVLLLYKSLGSCLSFKNKLETYYTGVLFIQFQLSIYYFG